MQKKYHWCTIYWRKLNRARHKIKQLDRNCWGGSVGRQVQVIQLQLNSTRCGTCHHNHRRRLFCFLSTSTLPPWRLPPSTRFFFLLLPALLLPRWWLTCSLISSLINAPSRTNAIFSITRLRMKGTKRGQKELRFFSLYRQLHNLHRRRGTFTLLWRTLLDTFLHTGALTHLP